MSGANEENISIKKSFLLEIKSFAAFMILNPTSTDSILTQLDLINDAAIILNLKNTKKLCFTLQGLFKTLSEKKIPYTEELENLIKLTGQELVKVAETDFRTPQEQSHDNAASEITTKFVQLCDKASAGEIFDLDFIKKSEIKSNKNNISISQIPDKLVQIPLKDINSFLNLNEGIIGLIFKINNDLEKIPASAVTNQIKSDISFIQNEVFNIHNQLLSSVKDEPYFIENHSDFHGFFVFANEKKYFLSAEYIVDVTYENELEYVTEQNQRHIKRIFKNEEDENETELIPVYSISSLLPGQTTAKKTSFDIVIIAEYMHQKIGMIADGVQKFATLVKKPLPPSFKNFKMLEGIVFDESYNMIPIISVPEMLKKFRAQRGYETKIFEANTYRRTNQILVVNDSDSTRSILKTILTANDFFVDLAKDGIDAIECLKNKQYDLIITDDDMPRMNGEILIDNIRRMELYKNVPIIAMSLNPIPKADAFVSKSDFRRSILVKTAKELLHE